MRSFAIVAPRAQARKEGRKLAESCGFLYDALKPEFILCIGGDGTLLRSEHQYPGAPKLLVRDSQIGKKYPDHTLDHALKMLHAGKYELEQVLKLQAIVSHAGSSARLIGLNDIILRNQNLAKAIRFSVHVDKRLISREIIGDGIVIATPFGSSAYYHSITKSLFKKGIGLAFNNTTEVFSPIVLPASATITLTILRGPAAIAADNRTIRMVLQEGDRLVVRKAEKPALILHPRP